MICRICGEPAQARELCLPHYQQEWRKGRLDNYPKVLGAASLKDRLLSFVDTSDPEACWEWKGERLDSKFNYGFIWRDGRRARAHRVSFELFCGPISAEEVVCHICDNPPCINPKHLFKGTRRDNIRDAVDKGRFPTGSRAPKISDEHVRLIRTERQISAREFARRLGVSATQVHRIRVGKRRIYVLD